MSALDAFPAQNPSLAFCSKDFSLPALSPAWSLLPGLSAALVPFSQRRLPSAAVPKRPYLSSWSCFGAAVLERRLIKADRGQGEAILMVVTDVGVTASLPWKVLVKRHPAGACHYGQGSSFYTENPLFW